MSTLYSKKFRKDRDTMLKKELCIYPERKLPSAARGRKFVRKVAKEVTYTGR